MLAFGFRHDARGKVYGRKSEYTRCRMFTPGLSLSLQLPNVSIAVNLKLANTSLPLTSHSYEGVNMAMRKKSTATGARRKTTKSPRRWVSKVKTVSTFPPEGLFTKDAPTIARTLASKKVSPKGAASGMRMLTYFINRGGKGLSKTRRADLERAKKLLSKRVAAEREARDRNKAA